MRSSTIGQEVHLTPPTPRQQQAEAGRGGHLGQRMKPLNGIGRAGVSRIRGNLKAMSSGTAPGTHDILVCCLSHLMVARIEARRIRRDTFYKPVKQAAWPRLTRRCISEVGNRCYFFGSRLSLQRVTPQALALIARATWRAPSVFLAHAVPAHPLPPILAPLKQRPHKIRVPFCTAVDSNLVSSNASTTDR